MRAVLTEDDCEELMPEVTPLAVAVMEADVEAMVWLMQLFDEKGLEWRDVSGTDLSLLAAERGKIESLTYLRANGCPWDRGTCSGAAYGGHLEVLLWAASERAPVGLADVRVRGAGRPPGSAAVGASERVPVVRKDVQCRG